MTGGKGRKDGGKGHEGRGEKGRNDDSRIALEFLRMSCFQGIVKSS